MEKTYEMQISVTVDEELLSCLLANACGDECGVAWWKSADPKARDEAERQLVEEGKDPCREDIWARMLLNGSKLRLLDPESDWHWSGHKPGEMLWNVQIVAEGSEPVGGEWHDVGIEDILKAVQIYGKMDYANACGGSIEKIVDDGDFWDADAVIQIAMYGDVIYG